MAKRGVITDFFDVQKFEKQLQLVSEGIRNYIELANKVQPLRAGLKGVEELKPAMEGVKQLGAEQAKYADVLKIVQDRIATLNGTSKEFTKVLLDEARAQKELAIAQKEGSISATEAAKQKLLQAKAAVENAKQIAIERKEKEAEARASEKQAVASAKAAAKKAEEIRPYKQLALAFAVAAKEAQDLAAKYGTMDKRSQAAAKTANALNNELKKIDATIGNHQRNVGDYGKALEGVGGKIKGLVTNFLSLIGIASIGSFFSSSIDEFIEMDKNVRLLQNTLRNIGIPEAFGRIETSANKLAKQFTFLDNDDILKTFNQLIVYGKLTEDQINDLIPVIIDFATASGQDLASATSTIIKALEGNGKALKEYGINMKDAKGVTEGFNLIMTELKPRIEGVGEAFGATAAGGLATAKQEFKNLKEEMGEGLLPVLVNVLGFLNKMGKGLAYLGGSIRTVSSDLIDLAAGDFGVLIGEGEGRLKRLEETQKRIEKTAAKNIADQELAAGSAGEAIDKLNQNLVAQQKIIDASKRPGSIFNEQDIAKANRSLRVTKLALEEIFKIQSGDTNKVLGLGDPDSGGKDKADAAKKAADEARRIREADAKAEFEIQKLNIERQADYFLKLSENEKLSYAERIRALSDYHGQKVRLINATAEFELKNTKLTGKEIELVEEKRIDAIISLTNDMAKKIAVIYTDMAKKVADINDAGFKKQEELVGRTVKGMTASVAKSIQDLNEYIEKLQAAAIDADKQYKKQKVELYHELYSELQDTISTFIISGLENEKNALQDLIVAIDEKAAKDIETVNQTVINEQEKANKIAVIEARASAEKARLENEKKKLDIQRAKIEKSASLIRIAVDTVTKVFQIKAQAALLLSNPLTAPYAAVALAQIPFVIAGGALAAAAVAATPIPKYKHGTEDHPGGPAEVGHGKKELVVTPEGKMMETPATPVVIDLPKHTKVFPDSEQVLKTTIISQHDKIMSVSEINRDQLNLDKVAKKLDQGFSMLNRTIKNKKEIHYPKPTLSDVINRTIEGNKEYFNRNGFTKW